MFKTIKKIGIKIALYKLYSRVFSNDEAIISACDRVGAYNYLKKYKYVLDRDITPKEGREESKKIWVCWLQGYDAAPHIVQKCIDSIKQHSPDMEVVLLDKSNIKDYLILPKHIEDKYRRGIISNAHYSDYLRISLIAAYGGIWIDSTVLLTDRLPEYITKADLFCFKLARIGKICASNWFIAAKQQHPLILQQKALLEEYWRNENRLVSYSIFHLFWNMVCYHNNTNEKIWNDVPYRDDINCKILQMELFSDFSRGRYEQIKETSSIHKLTYKFDKTKNTKNTFYDVIFG